MTLLEVVVAVVLLAILSSVAIAGGTAVSRKAVRSGVLDTLSVLEADQLQRYQARSSFLTADAFGAIEPQYRFTAGSAQEGTYSVAVTDDGSRAAMSAVIHGECLAVVVHSAARQASEHIERAAGSSCSARSILTEVAP